MHKVLEVMLRWGGHGACGARIKGVDWGRWKCGGCGDSVVMDTPGLEMLGVG